MLCYYFNSYERAEVSCEWLLSDGQMSEPKSLLVDTRLSAGHYFDVLAVMSWLAVILCNVLVRIINIRPALISQEIGRNFRSEKSARTRPDLIIHTTKNTIQSPSSGKGYLEENIYPLDFHCHWYLELTVCTLYISSIFSWLIYMFPPATGFLLNVTVGCLKLCHIFHLM